MEFKTNRTLPSQTYEIDNIAPSTSVKYLGVILDHNLKWEQHLHQLTTKLRKTIYKFILLRKCADIQNLRLTYHALVLLHITYGITAWGGACQNVTEKLNIIQRKIIKIMYRKPSRYPTDQLFQDTKLLTIQENYIKESTVQIFKRKTSLPPIQHNHSTRFTDKQPIYLTNPGSSFIQRQTNYLGTTFYNALPVKLKKCNSPEQFRRKLNNHLLKSRHP